MKKKKIWLISIAILIAIVILIAVLSTIFVKKVDNVSEKIDPEILRSMNYTEITDDDTKLENCEYVQFSTFFTRDLDGDGKAEKLLGTCRNVKEKDTLYMDLNVLSDGYLRNGKITINASNFNYSMNMVKDSVLANNYISNDVKEIELKEVHAGTQKLILGDVISNIGNNVNNYGSKSLITLTGEFVPDDGGELTPISKTIEITVDWHGETKANLNAYTSTYYYDNLSSNTVSFEFRASETQGELLLKDNISTATIPELNGYAPLDVKCTNNGVEYEYNEETRELKIKRNSITNEDGMITNSVSRDNTYSVSVTYPKEAYDAITSYTVLEVPVKSYYDGYNNPNEEFQNPYKSNEPEATVKIIFRETPKPTEPTGYIYNFYINIVDKKYISRPTGRYAISKQWLLNLYDNEEEVTNKEYVVRWQAVRGNLGEVSSMVMNEQKAESGYGDKWDDTIIENYTSNVGIYFSGADGMLGEDGTISIYNNDTNELIKTFTKEEWNKYSKENPFKYEEAVKHIRVETSNANVNSSLNVYNVKELDVNKIMQDFTKEQVKDVELVYTYLTGICNITNEAAGTVNKSDFAYYISEKSYADLNINQRKISTQETCVGQEIYIDAKCTQTGDAKWKNGEFIVEVPEEIINMEINNVITSNSNVNIVAYDLYKKDGKYLVKIITENSNPEEFRITIDCNMTANPTMPTKNIEFKLYAYNKYCNDYYYETTDIYDVDGDNNVTEKVGTDVIDSYSSIQLLSPTTLITLEKVSDYNDEGEITIAPNVAPVEKETKQAKINVIFTNNYPNTISNVQILGKIPFEGNTYIINGKDMKSKFTTTMSLAGVQVPDEYKEKALVYYSENENPTKDITDEANGWTLKENVEDFSKIKTYLVDFKDSTIPVGKEITCSYLVNLPDDISCNLASYSNHAIYFELNTEGGKLTLATEPNKVGVRIVKKFDLELTKYKVNSELTIPGVTYTLKYEEENEEGELQEKTRILTTNAEGKITLNNLYAEKTYKLQEIKVPDTCELNSEEIVFTVNADSTVQIVSGTVKSHNYTDKLLQISLEDEIKYNVDITKTKIGTGILIDGVRFRVEDEEGNMQSSRTTNGKASFTGLSLNKVYTLRESSVPETCELNEGIFTFKLVRENGSIKLESINNTLTSNELIVEDLETELTPTLKVAVENEIRYTFNLEKQDEEGNKLGGIRFNIKGKGFNESGNTYITSKEGKISISGLYVGETYTVEETRAFGYYLDQSKDNTIQFKVERINGSLELTKWLPGEGIKEIGTVSLAESTTDLTSSISTVLENEKIPTYNLKLVKENEDGEKLKGAQFKLTSKDTLLEQTVTTDENGEAILEGLYEFIDGKCILGEYTLEEIFAPEGYSLDKTKLEFKATKDAEGKVQISIINGDSIIKENEGTKLISSDSNTLNITILNKPIFSLKKYGDNNKLLPNAKFKITDLNGNLVTGTDGKIVGAPEGTEAEMVNVTFANSEANPWSQNSDGIWVSGGQGVNNAVSTLTSNEFTLKRQMKLSFDWSVSSESSSYDYVYYTITNVNTNSTIGGTSTKIGGTNYGTTYKSLQFIPVEKVLEPGTYKIEFTYRKDGSVNSGTDSAYVRNLSVGDYIDPNECIITTNEKGEIGANLPQGLYKAVEVEAPIGYKLPENEEDRTYYFGIGESKPEETEFALAWGKTIPSNGVSKLNDVAITPDGGIVVVGTIYENADLNGDRVKELQGKGAYDGIIVKYNSDGSIAWSKLLGGKNHDELFGIAKCPNGGYIVVGYTDNSEVYLDDTLIDTADFGNEEGIIVKIDEQGNYVWSQTVGGVGTDRINDVAVSSSGEVAVVGSYLSSDLYLDNNKTDTLTNSKKTAGVVSNVNYKDGFISVYTNNGEYSWSQNITGTSDVWASGVTTTNSGFAVVANFMDTAYLETSKTESVTSNGKVDGVVISYNANGTYSWSKQIGGSNNDEILKVIQDAEGNIVVVGSYTSNIDLNGDGTNDFTSKGIYDGIVVKYTPSGEYLKAKSIGGSSDDTISSLAMLDDGGLLLGGWYYSSSIDIDGDGTNDITSNSGNCDALIVKLNSDFELEMFDSIKGTLYDEINGVAEMADGGYIAVGNFDSTSLNIAGEGNTLTNSVYHDGMVLKYGNVVTSAEVPETREVIIQNELKEYTITTEIGENSEFERAGGTITGEYTNEYQEANNIKFVEKVKHGYDNTKEIQIVPDENYSVVELTINGEKVIYTPKPNEKPLEPSKYLDKITYSEDGTITLQAGIFENMTEDKHIVVTLERGMSSILVHHYLKNADGTYTTTSVAPDETYTGRVNDNYITSPRMDLEEYTLEKDKQGEYVVPENASGKYTEENQVITYYYEAKTVNLTVHHYLEGTETKLADDIEETHAEGYEYQTKASEEVLKDYELVTVDGEEQGILNEDTQVTYYYKLKEHKITTEVKEHTELRTDSISNEKVEVEVLGGTITGEYNENYKEENKIQFVETVKQKENSKQNIIITPDEGYKVKTITLESTSDEGNKQETILYGENAVENAEISITKNDDGTITLGTFTAMTENKHIVVEFEPILSKVIIHHIIKGETKDYKTETKEDFVDEYYVSKEIEIPGYELVETSDNTNGKYTEDVINVYYYYDKAKIGYSVHYFYDGVEDTSKQENNEALFESVITEYTDKVIDGYKLEKEENLPLTISAYPENNIINIYYLTEYKITTDVIEHTENYKDGTIVENVKGGSITAEDETAYETVLKGYDNTKEIVMTPEEGYEILKVKINGIEVEDLNEKIADAGSLTLEAGYFTNMQEDKHIEVEYRKTTKVIVKYLEEETEKVLAEEIEISGIEGQSYETARKTVIYYQASDIGITDENNKTVAPNGTMFADEITIIYWYAKIPSGIVERHIEINEKGETKELESKEISGFISEEGITNRKTYDGYIPVDGPKNDNANVTVAKKDETTKTVTFVENKVLEVWYYYEQQHEITTEVKMHKEIINGEEKDIEGGTISKEYETDSEGNKQEIAYETVLHRGDSSKKIVMTPNVGYRIKEVTINDSKISIENILSKDGSLTLEEKYFKDVQENKHVVVEFEKIPAKIIVKYLDVDTKEEVKETKEINGYVNDSYSETRPEIEGYTKAGVEPTNSKGTMKEDTITITYYYTKQYKITTDVQEHEEKDINGNKVEKKGGSISGEDEKPYESVAKGNNSTKEIIMKPDYGYIIKNVTINGEELKINSLVKQDGSITLPKGYFQNMQEDKHIIVEYIKKKEQEPDYEPVPAKVIVQYLEEGTEEPLAEEDNKKGYVNDDYSTMPKEIPDYELVEEKYPSNSKGKMTEEEIIVKYYYRKITPITENNDEPEIENNKEKEEKLPQTGQERIMYISIIAVIGTCAITVIAIGYESRKKPHGESPRGRRIWVV